MKANRLPRCVLVPVLDRDISEAALARGRSTLAGSDAWLVLLHVVSSPESGDEPGTERSKFDDARLPRWRQLAAAARAGHVFVEAIEGDPARVILSEAARFGSDVILLERPDAAAANAALADRVIARVLRAAPGRVRVVDDTSRQTAALPAPARGTYDGPQHQEAAW